MKAENEKALCAGHRGLFEKPIIVLGGGLPGNDTCINTNNVCES